MPRIAHIGDTHFKSDRIDESLRCFNFAVDKAIERGCETVVIPGDIWDKALLADEESGFTKVVEAMLSASRRLNILMCYGNHDKPGSLDVFRVMGVRVYSYPAGEEVGGVWYSALPYPTKQFLVTTVSGDQDETDAAVVRGLQSILTGLGAKRAEHAPRLPHVLLFHGNVLGSVTESGQIMYGGDVMVNIADLDLANCDYGAMNHIHKAQSFGKYYYAGSVYHKDFGELDEKFFNIVDVEVGKCNVEKTILPTTPMAVVRMTYNDNEWVVHDADLASHLRLIDMSADIKVKYKVTPEQAPLVDEEKIKAMYPRAKVKCEREVVQGERVRCAEIAEKKNLRDKVVAWGEASGESVGEGVLLKADEIEGDFFSVF